MSATVPNKEIATQAAFKESCGEFFAAYNKITESKSNRSNVPTIEFDGPDETQFLLEVKKLVEDNRSDFQLIGGGLPQMLERLKSAERDIALLRRLFESLLVNKLDESSEVARIWGLPEFEEIRDSMIMTQLSGEFSKKEAVEFLTGMTVAELTESNSIDTEKFENMMSEKVNKWVESNLTEIL